MDYGSVAGTSALAVTGGAISIMTGFWLPVIAVALIIVGVIAVRFGFRRDKGVDDV